MSRADRTVAHLLTPSGAGAIGMIRVTGPSSLDVAEKCIRLKNNQALSALKHGELRFGAFTDDGEVVDNVVVEVAHEHGFHVVDVMLHGGVRILERALESLTKCGAQFSAEPPMPAALWPVHSLVESEALEAMQSARTVRVVRFLARQRTLLSEYLAGLVDSIAVHEDLLRPRLAALQATAAMGIRLVQGATVAIVGPPNSGKSTLFNRLVGRPAAVVSPIAGTTRDWIDRDVEFDGIPIRLIDTAGRHETSDFLESLAIRKGESAAADCDLYLLVLDAGRWGDGADLPHILRESNTICVLNKADENDSGSGLAASAEASGAVRATCISARTGRGVEDLLHMAMGQLGFGRETDAEPTLFTQRQARVCSDILSTPDLPPFELRRRIRDELWRPVDSGASTGLE